jgi:hypothetical protein
VVLQDAACEGVVGSDVKTPRTNELKDITDVVTVSAQIGWTFRQEGPGNAVNQGGYPSKCFRSRNRAALC